MKPTSNKNVIFQPPLAHNIAFLFVFSLPPITFSLIFLLYYKCKTNLSQLRNLLFLKVTAKKTRGPATPSEFFSDLITPPLFPALKVRAISYRFAPDINRWQAEALVAIQEV
ncbi:hypothetical protein Gotur_002921, partial [Gossypium turneri]